MSKRVVVIGGGFGGLAAALRCRKLGFDVTLLERLNMLGGRARVFEKDGYRHDAGPTVITAPFLFEELFELFGENLKDHLNFKSLDPWYRFYFHNGKTFDYRPSIEDTNNEIRKFDENDVDGYDKLIHPLLVGGNPFTTTSIYALIHYLERKWGVYFCMGGTGKIVRELENLMLRQGITINKETDVEQISIINGKAENVVLNNGKKIPADLVICNADPPTVYSEMLPSEYSRDSLLKPKRFTHYSMGLYVLFFGSRKKFSDVAHHTIWMSERYKELLHDIFEKKILTEDFSLYLHRPTATDDTFAPEGCDSFYVLCPVPNLQGNVQWNSEGPKLKDRIVEALDKTIMPGLKENIEAEFWMTPEDFKNDYRSKYGAGFSVAPIFSQSAWFRYHNKDKKIPNLYFSAAGSHPGAGIPGVLCSAKVIEKLIIKDFKVSH